MTAPGAPRRDDWRIRLLLLALPRRFRDEFGAEMAAFWEAQRREAGGSTDGGAGLRTWLTIARDALGAGVRLRLRRAAEAPTMPRPAAGDALESAPDRFRGAGADLVFAFRSLRAAPLFSAAAVLTFGLAIGANTAIFGLVDSVLLAPLPYPEPDRLVRVWRTDPTDDRIATSLPEFRAWRTRARSFAGVAAWIETGGDVQWPRGAERLRGVFVSAGFFDVLGVPLATGRAFLPDEDVLGGPAVALVSERLWRERFGEARIGEATISIGRRPHRIVGVVAANVEVPYAGADYWLPLQDAQILVDLDLDPETRSLSYLDVVARLTPDASLAAARAEAEQVMASLDEPFGIEPGRFGVRVATLHDATVSEARGVLTIFSGAVALLLLIACANVAGLWLTRVAGRRHEIAVRTALGAPRRRLVRQLLVEALLLSLAGGLVALVAARALLATFLAIAPASLPRQTEVSFSGGVFLFDAFVALGCGLAFSLLPALRASRTSPALAFRAAGRTGAAPSGQRLQRGLVVAQVAMAVVLLVGAGLLAHSFARLTAVDPGVRTRDLLTVPLSPPLVDGDTVAVRGFYEQLLPRVRAIPGVASASFSYSPPMADSNFRQSIRLEGDADDATPSWMGTVIIGTDYFDTTGAILLRGRAFKDRDRLDQPHVAIVNESMATLWDGEDPVGKRFRTAGGISGSADSFEDEFFPDEWFTVVGVARDVRRRDLGEPPVGEFYRPHAQMSWPSMFLLVRAGSATDGLARQIQEIVWEVDPALPVEDFRWVDDLVAGSVAGPRFRLTLIGAFAIAAGVLAMMGVYAVMTLTVSRRTHEIGIRVALGASRGAVIREVLASGLALAAAGTTIGLAIALASSRVLAAMLYEISPADPTTLTAVVAVVGLVATAACYLPARRAAGLDPLRALRGE